MFGATGCGSSAAVVIGFLSECGFSFMVETSALEALFDTQGVGVK